MYKKREKGIEKGRDRYIERQKKVHRKGKKSTEKGR